MRSLRHATISGGSTFCRSMSTKVSVRVRKPRFCRGIVRLIGRKGLARTEVSRSYQGVLCTGFQLKLFRGPFASRGRLREMLFGGGRRTATLRTTHGSIMLLAGSNVLPLSRTGCGGMFMAKVGTSGRAVLKS